MDMEGFKKTAKNLTEMVGGFAMTSDKTLGITYSRLNKEEIHND